MPLRSAVPWTSIRTSTDWIVPVGTGTWLPPAAIVAAFNVYVAVPLAFTVGVTLLHPRKNVRLVVTTLKRGEPPWHWAVLASVNDAESSACPARPLIVAPADA